MRAAHVAQEYLEGKDDDGVNRENTNNTLPSETSDKSPALSSCATIRSGQSKVVTVTCLACWLEAHFVLGEWCGDGAVFSVTKKPLVRDCMTSGFRWAMKLG